VGLLGAESGTLHLQSLVVWLKHWQRLLETKEFLWWQKMGIRLEQCSLRNIHIPGIGGGGRHMRGKMASTSLSAESPNLLKYHVHHRLQRGAGINTPSMLPVSVWRGEPGGMQRNDTGQTVVTVTTPSG
jgi:hypothetical protein